MLLVRRKLPLNLLAITRNIHNMDREKSLGQAHPFNIWTIWLYEPRTEHQLNLRGTEPVFVDLLWNPGIDSQPWGLVRQPYLSYRPTRLRKLEESIPRDWFLGSINVYTYWARICKRFRSSGIDSKEWIPPAYVAWRAGTITLFLLGS